MSNWYPQLEGQLPREAVLAIRRVLDEVYAVKGRTGTLEEADFISTERAATTFGANNTRQQLQAPGSYPLNVTGLNGLLAQPQKAYVPAVSTLPNVLHDPMSQNGALVSLNGIVFWFDGRTEPGKWKTLATAAALLTDTHANRLASYPASDYPVGTVFWESDRHLLYENQGTYGASNWVYVLGTLNVAQSSIAGLGLGQYDDGVLIYVTDYDHILKWTWGGGPGSWGWGPGNEVSGKVEMFAVAPPATGWKAIDGTGDDGSPIGAGHPVQYLNANGSLGSITTMASMLYRYPKGTAAFTGFGNPVAATFAGATDVSNTNTWVGAGAADTHVATDTHTHNPGTLALSAVDPANEEFMFYFRK